jgi:uncharacterized membrane protein (UPF0127 family)
MFSTPARACTRLLSPGAAVIAIAVALAIVPTNPTSAGTEAQYLPISGTARIGSEILFLEVARTPDEQTLGLMFRPELPRDRGMLFPIASPRIMRMWMRNVPVPLDMVFVRDGRVIALAEQVPPCRETRCPGYGPFDEPVDAVVELRAGRIAELGLEPGDPIVITHAVDRPGAPWDQAH